jgi:glutathione S-transferase
VEAALDRLASMITPNPYLLGDAPTFADIAYPVTIQMAEIMGAEMGRPITVPAEINDWRDRTAEIDAVARSLTIAREAMENWMANFR